MKKAIYAGTFDPFHEGHLQVLKQAMEVFDLVYVIIAKNINKKVSTSALERKQNIEKIIDNPKIKILINETNLIADIAKDLGVKFLIRGIRDKTDLEYEFEIADVNHILNKELKSIFFITYDDKRKISSSKQKEIAFFQNKKE
ncbi:pantetheine-phosphate adenylyltransferase [Spiroplasma endosymbiont of Crioceris asparagi]|uniref:pantetheine-phosphate adenylyltransferase n=1 Tax=Spiroplasma endosymbiont of Crioceris asparagi TaxID=3066286 RepID=UPI0030CD9C13